MDFELTDYKRCTVVKGQGRLDSASAAKTEQVLLGLVESGKTIIMDMSGIDFVSSAGWWAIIRVQKELKKQRQPDLLLVALDENVRDSMDLVGILPYFTIYDDLLEAIANV